MTSSSVRPFSVLQLGREADLGVDDAVGGEVLGALEGDALDRVAVLHHADGVGERLEVEHQVVALGAPVEPRGEIVDVGGGQVRRSRTRCASSIDRARAQPPSRWSWSSDLGRPWIRSARDMASHATASSAQVGEPSQGHVGGRCSQFQSG